MTKVQKKQVLESLKKRNGDSGPTQKPAKALDKTKAKAKEILNGSKKSSTAVTGTKVGKSDVKKSAGKVVKAEKPKPVLGDSSDDSAMESSELEESSSDEDDEESDEDSDVPVKPANGKSNGAKTEEDSDEESDEDSEEESDEEIAKPTMSKGFVGQKPAPDVDDSDSDEASDEDEKPAPVASAGQKRKEAPAETASSPIKRPKPESNGSTSVFVGNLSWGIDEAWLASIFEPIGGVVSARIITDRETRRPKGFGYVEFETPEQAAKALELKDTEVDGRAINVDVSHGKSTPGAGTPRGGGAGGDRTQRYGDNKVSEPSATLFVGNLSWETTQDGLYELFGNSGCQSVRLPTDRESGRPKGFAYVEFSDVASAQSALTEFQGHYLDSRPLRVDFSQPRSNDGGGFGGRGGGRGGFDRNGGRGGGGRGGFRGGDRGGRGGGRGGFRGGRGAPAFAGKRTAF